MSSLRIRLHTHLHQLAEIVKVLVVIDRQLVLGVLNPVVFDLLVEADAQRVVAGEVGRFAHQKQTVLARLQQVFRLLAFYPTVEPSVEWKKGT